MPLTMNQYGLISGEFLTPAVRERYEDKFRAQVVRLENIIRATREVVTKIQQDSGLNAKGKGDRVLQELNAARLKLIPEQTNRGLDEELRDAESAIPTMVEVGRSLDLTAAFRQREIRDVLRAQEPANAAATVKTAVALLGAATEQQKNAASTAEFYDAAAKRAPADLKTGAVAKADATKAALNRASAARDEADDAAHEIIVALQTDPFRGVAPVIPESDFIEARDAYLRIAHADAWERLEATKLAVQIYKNNAVTAAGELNIKLELEYVIGQPNLGHAE